MLRLGVGILVLGCWRANWSPESHFPDCLLRQILNSAESFLLVTLAFCTVVWKFICGTLPLSHPSFRLEAICSSFLSTTGRRWPVFSLLSNATAGGGAPRCHRDRRYDEHAGGAGNRRAGLAAPSPGAGVTGGGVEQQGAQHQGPSVSPLALSCLGAAGLGASRGARARARGREAGSSRPCTWHLRWGGHSHGTPAACALAQPQRSPLLCPCLLQRAGRPIYPAPVIRVGKYDQTTIEHKNVV